MDGLSLLMQAQAAGLTVLVRGNELVVRGPKRLQAVAIKLLKHKAAVITALTSPTRAHGFGPQQPPAPTLADPALFTAGDKSYLLAIDSGMWFFQLHGHPEAGWTCCSDELVEVIENLLHQAYRSIPT